MSNLEFAWPYASLLFLLLLPLWWWQKKNIHQNDALYSPMAPFLASIAPRSQRPWYSIINFWQTLFWCLMVLGLMRLQYVGTPIEITRNGRSIMMVLDISESMETKDMVVEDKTYDRLTIAKEVMAEFIDKRSVDRIGLIVFGSEPFLHAPLSFDHPTIKQFLDEAKSGFAGPKTAIGDAIGLGVKKLLEEKGDRIMILLTDGQNNEGSLEPMKAAEMAKKYGIKIYAAGLGASRIMINGFFGAQAINPSESLDEAEPELQRLTAMTGGKYFRARDVQSLQKIYQEIDRLEPIKTDPVVLIPRKELYYWPLTLMVLFILIRALFSKKRLSWT